MILFVDQSGQLGGAELCLTDLAVHRSSDSRVLLFADGPFAAHLRTRGVTVEILSLPERAARLTKKASLLALASTLPALACHVAELRHRIGSASVAYFNTAKAVIHGAAANFPALRPAVFHLHDLLDRRHFSMTNIRLLVAAANRMQVVMANSHATADAFAAAGGRAPVEVVPNGFDPEAFDRIPESTVTAIRSTLNPEGRPVVAIFGRLSRWKGQDILLKAAAALPEMAVWVVGEALFTADDRAYAAELRRQAETLGGRVKFLGFRSDIPALMRAAYIVVHCSTAPEPFGRVIVEAMLARRPVVAARSGGPIEILDDATAGRLVSPGDSGSLTDALRDLMAHPETRKQLGEAGRRRAEAEYALPVVLRKMDAILDRLA